MKFNAFLIMSIQLLKVIPSLYGSNKNSKDEEIGQER